MNAITYTATVTLHALPALGLFSTAHSSRTILRAMTPSRSILLLLLLFLSLLLSSSPDPDLLLDYCVADASDADALHLNGGHPCIDPALASPDHFATSALSTRASATAPFGFAVASTNATTLPGANGQGLAMSRIDIAGGFLVPPHAHPRASETALLLEGALLVGFVDTARRLYAETLRPGDAFVFPRGLMHFLYNVNVAVPAVVLSGFNSQNPGVQLTPLALFASVPQFPEEVLEKAFKISGQDVHRIQKNLVG